MTWKTIFGGSVGLFLYSVVLILACKGLNELQASSSSKITVRDGRNRVIGYIDGGTVRDKNNATLGYIRNGKTYNKTNRLVATPEVPGILFCGN